MTSTIEQPESEKSHTQGQGKRVLLSRRDFVKGAAAVGAAAMSGGLATILEGCAPKAAAPAKVLTWKLAGGWTAGPSAYFVERFAKQVEEKSNGRLKFELYPAGQLYGTADLFGAVQKGLVEMIDTAPSYFSGPVPIYKMISLPFILTTNDEAKKWIDAGMQKLCASEVEKQGVRQLGILGFGPLQLFSTKPVRKLEDLKGMKLRGYDPSTTKAIELLGASSTVVAFPEVYTAMQRGVMDASWGGPIYAYSYRWHEVGKYVVKCGAGVPFVGPFVNIKAFESLPKDLQDILVAAGEDYNTHGWVKAAEFEKEMYDNFTKEGATVIDLPPEELKRWVDKVSPLWLDTAKEVGDVGTKALEIANKAMPGRVKL